VGIANADRDAAAEGRAKGEETVEQRRLPRGRSDLEDLDVGAAARTDASDHFRGPGDAIDIAGSHENAAGEALIVGEETGEHGARRLEDFHVRAAAGTRARHDFIAGNTVEVAGRHEDTSAEALIISKEVAERTGDLGDHAARDTEGLHAR